MTINVKQKGKRVELDIVHWLKGLGVASARRTQQFNGADGLSDVLAEEDLPSFHLEVKGTASPVLQRSKLKAWVKQVKTDCPDHLLPVIFHQANNIKPIAILTSQTYKKIVTPEKEPFSVNPATVSVSVEDSWNPSLILRRKQFAHELECYLNEYNLVIDTILAGFDLGEVSLVALRGDLMVKKMVEYETRIKANH